MKAFIFISHVPDGSAEAAHRGKFLGARWRLRLLLVRIGEWALQSSHKEKGTGFVSAFKTGHPDGDAFR
jgi:hypothetical protein